MMIRSTTSECATLQTTLFSKDKSLMGRTPDRKTQISQPRLDPSMESNLFSKGENFSGP